MSTVGSERQTDLHLTTGITTQPITRRLFSVRG
jgi:hypothetical protein